MVPAALARALATRYGSVSGVELIANRAPASARLLLAFASMLWLAACAAPAPAWAPAKPAPPPSFDPPSSEGGTRWGAALKYLPNRLFDLTDIVRMQVRVGPGWALGLHATSFVPLFIGGYNATWVGIPGPRNGPKVPYPLGLDTQGGFVLGGGQYGAAEFGLCAHIFMIGFDVGFDPRELLDFGAGLAGVDIAHDDF
jgi:hypothetical protein